MSDRRRERPVLTGWHLGQAAGIGADQGTLGELEPPPRKALVHAVETAIGASLFRISFDSPADRDQRRHWRIQWQVGARPVLERASRRIAWGVMDLCPGLDPVVGRYLRTGREDLRAHAQAALVPIRKSVPEESAACHALRAVGWACNAYAWESVPEVAEAARAATLANAMEKGLINKANRKSRKDLLTKVRDRHNRILIGIALAERQRQARETG